ncbi:MAG: hypothetical protein ABSF37_02835 [Sedimentisphaerales bacterium]
MIARKGAFIEVCRRCYQTTIGCGCFAAFIGPARLGRKANCGQFKGLVGKSSATEVLCYGAAVVIEPEK